VIQEGEWRSESQSHRAAYRQFQFLTQSIIHSFYLFHPAHNPSRCQDSSFKLGEPFLEPFTDLKRHLKYRGGLMGEVIASNYVDIIMPV
jgi:hypothetical protein